MAQTKFDKQVEETAESLVSGIGRILAGRDLDGVKRTDATLWHSGTRVLPKVEGRVRRRSYRAGGSALPSAWRWGWGRGGRPSAQPGPGSHRADTQDLGGEPGRDVA